LKDLLKDFPSVRAAPLGDALIITGEVSSEADLAAIQSIAEAAGVKSMVRYVPPVPVAPPPADTKDAPASSAPTPAPTPAPAPPAPDPAPSTPKAVKYTAVEYEIQFIEASVGFYTGVYAQGVEPSGTTLVSRTIRGSFGSPTNVEIMDPKLVEKSKNGKDPKSKGLRLKFTPSTPEDDGTFTTLIDLETNLPFESKAYNPALWRKAHWQVGSISGTAMGVAGADLLAILPENQNGTSVLGAVRNIAGVASGFGAPGASYGSAVYYDPEKKTQLLMLVRPRLIR